MLSNNVLKDLLDLALRDFFVSLTRLVSFWNSRRKYHFGFHHIHKLLVGYFVVSILDELKEKAKKRTCIHVLDHLFNLLISVSVPQRSECCFKLVYCDGACNH